MLHVLVKAVKREAEKHSRAFERTQTREKEFSTVERSTERSVVAVSLGRALEVLATEKF